MSIQDEIKGFIVECLKGTGKIMGSTLGSRLRSKFPDIDLKEYGGLKRFIENNCKDEVVTVRGRGRLDAYTHVSHTPPGVTSESQRDLLQIPQGESESIWRVFSNPNLPLEVLVNSKTGRPMISSDGESVSESFINIDKISREEYRDMAWEFLPVVNESRQAELRKALDLEDFWPRWAKLVNKNRADGTFERWREWRKEHIIRLFENRLKLANLPDHIIRKASTAFKESQEYVHRMKQPKPTGGGELTKHNSGAHSLRDVVHSAIDRMSEDELRRISLPAGIVVDIISKR